MYLDILIFKLSLYIAIISNQTILINVICSQILNEIVYVPTASK